MAGKNVHEMDLGTPLVDSDEFYATRSPYGVGDDVRIPAAAVAAYVDSELDITSRIIASTAGLDWKDSVRVATTANITLSATQTIDGVTVAVGERVLVKNQTTASQNGIYVVASGAWARAADAASSADVNPGMYCVVEEGTENADTAWFLTTNAPITLGSTSLSFTKFKPPLEDGEVTDAKIGDRTIDDTLGSPASTGTLTQLLSWIGRIIKGITGKASWLTAPRTTLENAVKLNGDKMTGPLSVGDNDLTSSATTISLAVGDGNFIDGVDNLVTGDGNSVEGDDNLVAGLGNTVTGDQNDVGGSGNTVTGNNNFVRGSGLTVTGNNMFVFGNPVTVDTPTSGTHATTKSYVDTADAALSALDALKLPLAGGTMTGTLTLLRARFTQTAITYAATTTLDFDANDDQTLTLTGNVTFATSNRAAGRTKTVKIDPGASNRTITYPAWIPINAALPTTFTASKIVVLTLKCYGTAETDVVASVGAQP